MIFEKGNIWSMWGKTDLWLFTGNAYIKTNGELVMGRGLALEMKKRMPEAPARLGSAIARCGDAYGIVIAEQREQRYGVFQVKYHFGDVAKLSLIGHSCTILMQYIDSWEIDRVDVNFPGIGFGKLDRHLVLPIISELPDVVHVWEWEE